MNSFIPKVLLSFHSGALQSVTSNGLINVFVEHFDGLDGIQVVEASEIPDADFEALILGKNQGEIQGAVSDEPATGNTCTDWRKVR